VFLYSLKIYGFLYEELNEINTVFHGFQIKWVVSYSFLCRLVRAMPAHEQHSCGFSFRRRVPGNIYDNIYTNKTSKISLNISEH